MTKIHRKEKKKYQTVQYRARKERLQLPRYLIVCCWDTLGRAPVPTVGERHQKVARLGKKPYTEQYWKEWITMDRKANPETENE